MIGHMIERSSSAVRFGRRRDRQGVQKTKEFGAKISEKQKNDMNKAMEQTYASELGGFA